MAGEIGFSPDDHNWTSNYVAINMAVYVAEVLKLIWLFLPWLTASYNHKCHVTGLVVDLLSSLAIHYWPTLIATYILCIAENFQGRKHSQISRFWSHPWKFSPWNLGMPYPPMLGFSILRKFSLQIGHSYLISESFLPRKFSPLKVSRYTCMYGNSQWVLSVNMHIGYS